MKFDQSTLFFLFAPVLIILFFELRNKQNEGLDFFKKKCYLSFILFNFSSLTLDLF